MARSRIRPESPRRIEPEIPRILQPSALVRSGEVYAAEIGWDGVHADGAHSRVSESRMHSPVADRLDLTGATLHDVRIESPAITELVAPSSTWHAVAVEGGRLGTLDLSRSRVDAVILRGIRIAYLSLAAATVRDVVVEDCRIGTLDLPGAQLDRVAFSRSSADEVDTREMRTADLDLRGLDAAGFTDVRALRGASLTADQVALHATALAAALGIEIRDGRP